MGRRTQAERDAMTTEIGFALFAGAVMAGAAYFGVTEFLPDVVGPLRGRSDLLRHLAASTTLVVFVAVVSIVLTRFRHALRAGRQAPAPPGGPGAAQPSQPGRTNPDS
ncbi:MULTISPECIES: DUF6332 family protein [Streptomyces]|uniref:DUF6332 family protein n=1 Tax=Streptomyces caniscabiei TaxID=2746961 RepID=A0ABU4MWH7_9ACTN|nr:MULTISPECIES: DUF6332 family protein [Streptomyces]MBE4741101.1 hypothetical protein [Streptomyces caniscabiei]MBE4760450.1 hypothetical protein [Streptomyces caniscabiei]MBE4774384.1 hypothetical protein [Streptomyces caniscabiei]MBE4789393.1 hypothetical protein [Streptomyces caniscabiei]MBE4798492.1 hypothetical protein [Streptomyces caniscabiei]